MVLSYYISLRYLFSKKKRNAINIISWISVSVVAVSTAALIIVFSVFNGFNELVLSMQKSYDPELKIYSIEGKTFNADDSLTNKLISTSEILAFSSVLEENALFSNNTKQKIAILKGVGDNYIDVVKIDSLVWSGAYNISSSRKGVAVFGAGVARELSILVEYPGVINVLIPNRLNKDINNPNEVFNEGRITATGIASGDEEFDNKYVLTSIALVRELTDRDDDDVSFIEVSVKPGFDVDKVKKSIQTKLGKNFEVRNRMEQHATLYRVMATEKWATFFILSFIILIASFSIISSLTMLIIEKKNDIFIFKSFGADKLFLRKTFIMTGWFISVLGALIGLIFGSILTFLQQKFGLLEFPNSEALIISAYPVKFMVSDFIITFLSVSTIGLFTAFLPVLFTGKKLFAG